MQNVLWGKKVEIIIHLSHAKGSGRVAFSPHNETGSGRGCGGITGCLGDGPPHPERDSNPASQIPAASGALIS